MQPYRTAGGISCGPDEVRQPPPALSTLRRAAPRGSIRSVQLRPKTVAILVVLLGALAWMLRALGLEVVFPGDGTTVFLSWDSYYHARRAVFGLANFPHVLAFDPYLSHPDGAIVPWPPLYDFLLAAAAKLAGAGPERFDAVAAWVPPVLAALTVPFVYLAARAVASVPLALGAAAIFAVLPASSLQSSVGVIDHHAAVSLFATALLACALQAVGPRRSEARNAVVFGGLAVARAALLLTWTGGTLFLVIVDPMILLAAAWTGRRDLARGESLCALGSALLVAPFALGAEVSVGGSASVVVLSALHVAALVALGATAGLLAAALRQRPVRGAKGLAVLAGAGVISAAVALGVVGLPGGADWIAGFLGREDPWAAVNLEQVPLSQFAIPGSMIPGPFLLFGGYYAVAGLAIVAVAARARTPEIRPAALGLAAWTLVLGVLAVRQVRFAVDFAPAAAISFAILSRDAVDWLAPARLSPKTRARVAFGAALVLLAPAIYGIHVQRALFSHRYLVAGTLAVPDRALLTHEGTLLRFAEQVRAATPETAGFLDEGRPAFGVTAFSGLGHVLHHVARRATPADNFGHYLGERRFFDSQRVFDLEDEAEAVASLEALRTPYLVTADLGGDEKPNLLHRLHRRDGGEAAGRPRLERFRLVTEGPAGGVPIGTLFGEPLPPQTVPYKLFEVVRGAELEILAAPGTKLRAEIELETPLRRFRHRAEAVAGADGVARLRVPYSTRRTGAVRATGPWNLEAGARRAAVEIDEAAVRDGATLRVEFAAP